MHLYGSTVINTNCIRSMVNLMLYIVIYCKQVHYTTDSLVWGLLKLTPITAVTGSEVMIFQINNGASNYFI